MPAASNPKPSRHDSSAIVALDGFDELDGPDSPGFAARVSPQRHHCDTDAESERTRSRLRSCKEQRAGLAQLACRTSSGESEGTRARLHLLTSQNQDARCANEVARFATQGRGIRASRKAGVPGSGLDEWHSSPKAKRSSCRSANGA